MEYHHTKFGLTWIKESKVTEGGRNPPPPQVENVLNRPGEIGLNQSKSSIILKKERFSLCLLNKWVAVLFICLYMLEASSVTWAHLHYNK